MHVPRVKEFEHGLRSLDSRRIAEMFAREALLRALRDEETFTSAGVKASVSRLPGTSGQGLTDCEGKLRSYDIDVADIPLLRGDDCDLRLEPVTDDAHVNDIPLHRALDLTLCNLSYAGPFLTTFRDTNTFIKNGMTPEDFDRLQLFFANLRKKDYIHDYTLGIVRQERTGRLAPLSAATRVGFAEYAALRGFDVPSLELLFKTADDHLLGLVSRIQDELPRHANPQRCAATVRAQMGYDASLQGMLEKLASNVARGNEQNIVADKLLTLYALATNLTADRPYRLADTGIVFSFDQDLRAMQRLFLTHILPEFLATVTTCEVDRRGLLTVDRDTYARRAFLAAQEHVSFFIGLPEAPKQTFGLLYDLSAARFEHTVVASALSYFVEGVPAYFSGKTEMIDRMVRSGDSAQTVYEQLTAKVLRARKLDTRTHQ